MSKGKRKTRNFRILKMMILLAGKSRKWSASDLAEYFGVSSRTIYRDRKLLENMGVPIFYNKQEKSYEIKDSFHFTPPNLTKEEARALFLVSRARKNDNNFIYPKKLNEALNKVMCSLPEVFRNKIKDENSTITYLNSPHIDFSVHRDKIKKIERKINNRRVIKIDYFSLSREEITQRKVEPYNIFLNNGAAYMVGYCHVREEKRIFRIDRIERITDCKSHYTIPADFSLSEYLESAFNVERGEERKVVLRFTGTASYLVREVQWDKSEEIEEIDEDEIIYSLKTGSRKELKSWILQYGSEVEVLKPKRFRHEVIKEINKMKKIYE